MSGAFCAGRVVGRRRGEGERAAQLSVLLQRLLLHFTANPEIFVLSLLAVFVHVRMSEER